MNAKNKFFGHSPRMSNERINIERFIIDKSNALICRELCKVLYTKPKNLELKIYEGEHQFSKETRKASYEFLNKHI